MVVDVILDMKLDYKYYTLFGGTKDWGLPWDPLRAAIVPGLLSPLNRGPRPQAAFKKVYGITMEINEGRYIRPSLFIA